MDELNTSEGQLFQCWVIAHVFCGGGFRLTGQVLDSERFLPVCNVPVDSPRTCDRTK